MSQTTITIRPETRDRLKAAKRGGETYDELLARMLDRESENRKVYREVKP